MNHFSFTHTAGSVSRDTPLYINQSRQPPLYMHLNRGYEPERQYEQMQSQNNCQYNREKENPYRTIDELVLEVYVNAYSYLSFDM